MSDPDRTIWCGNLSSEVDEDLLYELFLQAGPLEKVTMPQDSRTGEKRSYAFILFEHEQSVHYAIELLEGTELFDRRLRLQPKADNFQEKHRNVDEWLGWGHRYCERPPSLQAAPPPVQQPPHPGYQNNGLVAPVPAPDPSLALRQGFMSALSHAPNMLPAMSMLSTQHVDHVYQHRHVYRDTPYYHHHQRHESQHSYHHQYHNQQQHQYQYQGYTRDRCYR